MKESLVNALLESADMKLMALDDAPTLRCEIRRLEAKVSKVGKERYVAMALKSKAEKHMTASRIELHEKKFHNVTTINMEWFLRIKAEKELTKCKEDTKNMALTIKP